MTEINLGNFMDKSIRNLFKDALTLSKNPTQALFLNHNMLTEAKGGCALWENREWVESLTSSKE